MGTKQEQRKIAFQTKWFDEICKELTGDIEQ